MSNALILSEMGGLNVGGVRLSSAIIRVRVRNGPRIRLPHNLPAILYSTVSRIDPI